MTSSAQLPLRLRGKGKTEIRAQFGALCYRMKDDRVEICLVTTRRTKRWIVPKGWPMHKETPAKAAATEAWEEAGLKGNAFDNCLGAYSYDKETNDDILPVLTFVYPVEVTKQKSNWPERKERKRKWYSQKKAAKKVEEPGLKAIIKQFDPTILA